MALLVAITLKVMTLKVTTLRLEGNTNITNTDLQVVIIEQL
jgi:hypothetical protein